LDSGALAQGYVTSASTITTAAGASIIGEAKTNEPLSIDAFRWRSMLPTTIAPDRTITAADVLSQGSYGRVVVAAGATLGLGAGRYDFDSLVVQAGGHVTTAGLRTTLNVRTRLLLDGSVMGDEVSGSVSLLLKYFGRESLTVRAPFRGALVSGPGVRVAVAGTTFRGSINASDIALRPNSTFEYGPLMTSTRAAAPLSGVGIVGEDANPDSSQEGPVEVLADNPFFHGTFDSLDRISGTSEGMYSHNYEWSSVRDAQFDIRSFSSPTESEPFGHAWGNLPSDGSGDPLPAGWHFRSGRFLPGTTYAVDAYLTSFDASFALTTQNATRLWAKLSPDVTVIPLIAVLWYETSESADNDAAARSVAEDRERQVTAVVDFAPLRTKSRTNFEYFSVDGVDPMRLINGIQVPPDDIWSQCGIQFRLVGSFVLGRHGPPNCQTQSRTYAQDLEDRIRALRPDLAALWFGNQALRPFILEIGEANGCQWYGNTAISAQAAQLNTLDWSSTQNGVVVAHELGHIMLGPDHVGSSGTGNLMAAGAATSDRLLTADQCTRARSAAMPFRQRLQDYAVARGEARQVFIPATTDAGWLKATKPSLPPKVCCDIDGQHVRTFGPLCSYLGAPSDADSCKVCCAVNDPAYRDADGSFLIQKVDECSADRTLQPDQCDLICCDRGGPRGTRESRYECLANVPGRGYEPGSIVTGDRAQELCPSREPT